MSKSVFVAFPYELNFTVNVDSYVQLLKDNGYTTVRSIAYTAEYLNRLIDNLGHTNKVCLSILSDGISDMCQCDALFLPSGWRKSRICKIERMIAKKFDMEIIYE